MNHDVFISYSTQDKPTADAICRALEVSGIRCWIAPRDALPGHRYQGSIVRAIRDCSVMVLVFSSRSNASDHVLREVTVASEERKPVLPFRIEDVEIRDDLYYYVSSVHWLDALIPPVEAHVSRLVEVVARLMSMDRGSDDLVGDEARPDHTSQTIGATGEDHVTAAGGARVGSDTGLADRTKTQGPGGTVGLTGAADPEAREVPQIKPSELSEGEPGDAPLHADGGRGRVQAPVEAAEASEDPKSVLTGLSGPVKAVLWVAAIYTGVLIIAGVLAPR